MSAPLVHATIHVLPHVLETPVHQPMDAPEAGQGLATRDPILTLELPAGHTTRAHITVRLQSQPRVVTTMLHAIVSQ